MNFIPGTLFRESAAFRFSRLAVCMAGIVLSLAANVAAQTRPIPPAPSLPPRIEPVPSLPRIEPAPSLPTGKPVAPTMAPAPAQNARRGATHASICGNPKVPCKTSATFQPNDLPFRVPENAVIFDTELFYAIVLKSVGANDADCDVFVPESERLQTQALFPDHKVFASRCADPETLFYTNTSPQHRFMAVYAGTTLAEANSMLAVVKATGKFPTANIRRMRTGFNGT